MPKELSSTVPPQLLLTIRGWGPDAQVHYIAQAPYTYAVVGLMNEKQVSIVETTWDGRKELRNPEGWLGYFTLMQLALQRSATAREALRLGRPDLLLPAAGTGGGGASSLVRKSPTLTL